MYDINLIELKTEREKGKPSFDLDWKPHQNNSRNLLRKYKTNKFI